MLFLNFFCFLFLAQGKEETRDQGKPQRNAKGYLQSGRTAGIKFVPITGDHRFHGAVKGAAGDQGDECRNTKDGGGCLHPPCHSFRKQLADTRADGGSRQIPEPEGSGADEIHAPNENTAQRAGEKLFLFYVEKKGKSEGA